MGPWQILVVAVYALMVVFLGYLGWRHTTSASDYLLAGRKAHPAIMALSYGSTFISTSAIVGFGGVSAMFGMSLLWLAFLNIFVGIFIAFVFLGGRTRRIGHRLDAHTFPEFLGRRYGSKFIQVFAGLVIFIFMPVYAAAVLIGGGEFITQYFGVSYTSALVVFSIVVGVYVIIGGIKGVMYTDALQAVIMIVGMAVLLIWTYMQVGGVQAGHQGLADMKDSAFVGHKAIGFAGWTDMPAFGWGDKKFDLWWIVVTNIMLGVGVGVLAQPQLAVRFMTVKSQRELNRAVLLGGLFILMLPGVVYVVGPLTNLYFARQEAIVGTLVSVTDKTDVIAKKERFDKPVTFPCRLLHIDTTGNGKADTNIVAEGLGEKPEQMPRASLFLLADGGAAKTEVASFDNLGPYLGKKVEVHSNSTSFTRALDKDSSGAWMFNPDSIVPIFITRALPSWFGVVFLLTLLAAAMSTLSGQFHAQGTAIARDVLEQVTSIRGKTVLITRIGIVIGIVLAVLVGWGFRGDYIIARATAMFFGMCAAAFLPTFVGGLYSKRVTAAGAIASILVGFAVTLFWLLFIKDTEARAVGLCHALTGKASLLLGVGNWYVVDPLLVALPLSTLVLILVSLFTRKPSAHLLALAFEGAEPAATVSAGGFPVAKPKVQVSGKR